MSRSDTNSSLLKVEGLSVHYSVQSGLFRTLKRLPSRRITAVDGVSFVLGEGEMLALVGESGCGKTSTAQAVLRQIDAASGKIWFNGQDITHLDRATLRPLRRKIQMIYQDPYEALDPRYSVGDTIEEPLLIHEVGSAKSDRRERVSEALVKTGLTPPELYINRYPRELSGGQRQRVAIAASLVLSPQLLIADEPVSMLDVSVRAGILSVLEELCKSGMGLLMITHDLSTAAHYADRIAVMYLGRIVEEGKAQEVVSNPQHPYTQALISAVPDPNPRAGWRKAALRGEAPNAMLIPAGCRFHPRCPVVLDSCRLQDVELRPVQSQVGHVAACVRVSD